ncbi:uncharacterized protein MYCGRDRAFT_97643 [Zymoseptoria tritici IPO323]|uniref:Transcription factor domain-containing protein n=1 Tax=Zymoseptoria tritici (strain CBS 115943 / IPO323) TaxID=336722 RepID=F9XQV2_ZYMTI|nr:uncharacterized protein MYCGRDRAFT_97643 [Zymoseptoria tritici IPO323]EGP82294.1 hypothetical protein MYCGRDRAFT_97643 [Zymoseptoria tritici IPO323]
MLFPPTDDPSPLLELLNPETITHQGLLHGVLSLSATLLQAAEEIPNSAWKLRQAYHFGQALSLLRQGIERAASPANGGLEVNKLLVVQSLVLYLQVICEGHREGQDRSHLGGMKWIVSGTSISPHNVTLEVEVRMFILYHNYCSCLTSPSTPFDYDFWKLKNSLQSTPESSSERDRTTSDCRFMMDVLFTLLPRIRTLRDQARTLRASGKPEDYNTELMVEAYAIDTALRSWPSLYNVENTQHPISMLWRACIYIYLIRTIRLSCPSEQFSQAVDTALEFVSIFLEDVHGWLLSPLFLIGCAAWDEAHREIIDEIFHRLSSRTGRSRC